MNEATGLLRDHEVSAAMLLLWSAGVTGVPRSVEGLEEPAVVRRMCRMAADLPLVNALRAPVNTAIAIGTEARSGAARIARTLEVASDLADTAGTVTPALVFRMWRVAHLPSFLRPDSTAPEAGRSGLRAYDEALETALGLSGGDPEPTVA